MVTSGTNKGDIYKCTDITDGKYVWEILDSNSGSSNGVNSGLTTTDVNRIIELYEMYNYYNIEPDDTDGLFSYALSNDGKYYTCIADVNKFTDKTDKIVFPYEYNGLPVQKFKFSAFPNTSTYFTVYLPNTVTSVDLTNIYMSHVYLPKNVDYVNNSEYPNNLHFAEGEGCLKYVVVDNHEGYIPNYTFKGINDCVSSKDLDYIVNYGYIPGKIDTDVIFLYGDEMGVYPDVSSITDGAICFPTKINGRTITSCYFNGGILGVIKTEVDIYIPKTYTKLYWSYSDENNWRLHCTLEQAKTLYNELLNTYWNGLDSWPNTFSDQIYIDDIPLSQLMIDTTNFAYGISQLKEDKHIELLEFSGDIIHGYHDEGELLVRYETYSLKYANLKISSNDTIYTLSYTGQLTVNGIPYTITDVESWCINQGVSDGISLKCKVIDDNGDIAPNTIIYGYEFGGDLKFNISIDFKKGDIIQNDINGYKLVARYNPADYIDENLYIKSSTENSDKVFKITITDNGQLSAEEIDQL